MLFLLTAAGLSASPYDMILTGDPVIEDIRFLSLETGNPVLSFTPPFAPHEIKNFLNRIDPDTLSLPAKEAYNRIRERLSPSTPLSLLWENFALFFNIDATVEGRVRFNTDMDWHPFNSKIPSLLSVPLRLFFSDSLMLYVDPAIGLDPHDYYPDGNFSNNIVFLPGNDIHGNSPFRTFVAAGGPWWNFQLGRDRLSFGTGISGNLGIADNPPFYEFARLSFFSDQVKYSLVVIQSPLRLTEEFYPALDPNGDYLQHTTQRYFYQSRIDFSLFNKVNISLQEGVMVGNSALELRYLNPLMIFHNAMMWRDYDDWPANEEHQGFMLGSFFTAELNWSIIKSLSFYAQFAMTELSIGPELEEGREEPPNGVGVMGGLQFSRSIGNWGAVFYLECIYTSPFLYMLASPYASLIFMHHNGFVHSENYYYFFGYNRDTFALTLGTKMFNGGNLTINGELSWVSQGERGGFPIVWDWTKKDQSASPSGTPQNNFILSVGASWKLFPFLTLNGNVTGIYSQNYNHNGSDITGGQVSLSVNFHY